MRMNYEDMRKKRDAEKRRDVRNERMIKEDMRS